jgi:hypothetical protein
MAYDVTGKLHKVFDTENKTDSFRAREFVIETDDRGYKNYIKFQLTQDRCDLIESYKPEDMITVTFDLRGREWNEKYFTNLNAWKIAPLEQPSGGESSEFPSVDDEPSAASVDNNTEDFDDLPF